MISRSHPRRNPYPNLIIRMNLAPGFGVMSSSSNNTALTIKSSPPKTATVATRLGVQMGTLTKRNEQQQWQRRYCVLVPQTLLYYFETEYSESARGIIDLEYYSEVETIAKNTIRLSTPADIPLRNFFFRADGEEQCAAWAAALTRERYFVVADERDAYQKLQAEFQRESSATAERVEGIREELSGRRARIEQSGLRQQAALSALRTLAVSMGLSSDAAASIEDPKDALREVGHRMHYYVRRASHLEGAIDALRGQKAPRTASRIREIDELRERLSAAKRAKEREATARAALQAEKTRLRAQLDELQHKVQVAAQARLKLETKAAELHDQKKLLVREVKSTRKAIAKTIQQLQEEPHMNLALQRVGFLTSSDASRLYSTSDQSEESSSVSDQPIMTPSKSNDDLLVEADVRPREEDDAVASYPLVGSDPRISPASIEASVGASPPPPQPQDSPPPPTSHQDSPPQPQDSPPQPQDPQPQYSPPQSSEAPEAPIV